MGKLWKKNPSRTRFPNSEAKGTCIDQGAARSFPLASLFFVSVTCRRDRNTNTETQDTHTTRKTSIERSFILFLSFILFNTHVGTFSTILRKWCPSLSFFFSFFQHITEEPTPYHTILIAFATFLSRPTFVEINILHFPLRQNDPAPPSHLTIDFCVCLENTIG